MNKLLQKLTTFGLGFILVANLVDIVFTLWFIYYGDIPEANPIMDFMLESEPFLFVFVKTFFVSLGVLGLHLIRRSEKHRKLVQIATYGCFSIYFALLTSFYLFLATI